MRALGWALLATAAAGCSSVIGLDGFTVDQTGAAGSAGVGTGGTAGVAGTAGSAGTAGVGGTAGTGGTPPCGSVLTPDLDVVRACVLRTGCAPFVPSSTISTCITLDLPDAFIGTACASNAQSCDDIELCEGYGYVDTQCAIGQTGWRCDSNVAVNCDVGYFVSCNKRGGTCVMYDSDGDFVPDRAGCRVETSCFEPPGALNCNGDNLYECVNGEGIGAICTNLGANCKTEDAQTGCFFQTPSCNGTEPPCNGNVGQQCTSGGSLLQLDCGAVNLSCNSDADGPYCVAPGCTLADIALCTESCTGSVMHVCYGGVPYDVDCTAYGFTLCVEGDDPQGLIPHYATCVP